jgi:hypothetical protein
MTTAQPNHGGVLFLRWYFMFKVCVLSLLVTLTVATQPVSAGVISNLPDAIACSVKDPTGILPWEELVFFVSAHTRDGDTLYKTLTSGPLVLIVASNGIITGPNLAGCDGLKIQDLVDAGRAFHLTQS